MKKYIVILASAVLALTSCQEKFGDEGLPEGELFTASIRAGSETNTRAALEFPSVIWEDEDHIAVFDGYGMRDFTISSHSGSSAVFSGSLAAGSSVLTVAYPYSAAVSADGSNVTVSVPAEQKLEPGKTADSAALVSVGRGARESTFTFRNICGLVKVTVDRDDVRELILHSASKEPLAGTATVNASTGVLVSTEGAVSTVSLRAAGECFEAGDYYIAVLPGTLAPGFTVTAVTTGNKSGSRTTTQANEVPRNGGIDNILLSEITWSYDIYTFSQFKLWAANPSACEEGRANLRNDITIDSGKWTPAALSGATLYGHGHSIGGFTSTASGGTAPGLFSSVTDCVFDDVHLKDIRIKTTSMFLGGFAGEATGTTFTGCSFNGNLRSEATAEWTDRGIITTDNNNFGLVGGFAGLAVNCIISDCEYRGVVSSLGKCVGGFAGVARNSTIEGCSTVIGSEVYTYYHCAGFICGALGNGTTVRDCSLEGYCAVRGYFVGGVTGWMDHGTVQRCVVGSHAYISSTQYEAGGIAGHFEANGGNAIIDRCTVYGKVQGQYNVGGIAGYVQQRTASRKAVISNCAYLDGELFSTGVNSNLYSLVGGILGWNQTSAGNTYIENCVARPACIKTLNNREKRLTEPAEYTYKTIGGAAGLLGFTNGGSTTTMSNCYTSVTKPDFYVSHQGIDAFSSVFANWGALYGKANTNLVYGAACYRDSDTRSGSGAPASTSGEVGMTVQKMTDGTMLSSLNSNKSACTASGFGAESWVAGDYGYPQPASVIADPHPVDRKTLKVSVCGDSISTFNGYIPASYAAHYPCATTTHSYCTCVHNVNETYWYKLIYGHLSNARLDMNMSYSGSAVARSTNTDYNTNHWYTQCYVQRYVRQGGIGNPDIIIIHGGTNDWAHNDTKLYPGSATCKTAGAPSNSVMSGLFTTADAATTRAQIEALNDDTFCEAYIKMLKLFTQQYPGVKVICIVGDYLSEGIEQSIVKSAAHYGAKVVNLFRVNGFNDLGGKTSAPYEQPHMPKHDFDPNTDSTGGCHPAVEAMTFIADKIYTELGPWLESASVNKTAEADFDSFDALQNFTM
ncbi:MAG: hypothetical protein IJS66_01570 [Bacteroidales bacterium]|nr:hypothetical protein [Bacteroidales bacterium]